MLHDVLEYRKVLIICTIINVWKFQFLKRCEEDSRILRRIVTIDKTWVHHYDSENKKQSVEWRRLFSPATKKFKSQPFTRKIMLTFFWNMMWHIRALFQAHAQIVKGANYCALLRNKFATKVQKKQCRNSLGLNVFPIFRITSSIFWWWSEGSWF